MGIFGNVHINTQQHVSPKHRVLSNISGDTPILIYLYEKV